MLFGHDEGKNIKQLCNGEKDVVCIKMGGTGAETAADARNNILEGNPLSIKEGGTGAETEADARSNLGLAVDDFYNKVVFKSGEEPVNCQFIKVGSIVHIYYQGQAKAHAVTTVLFTIPEEYLPTNTNSEELKVVFPLVKNANAYGLGMIMPNGECIVSNISSTSISGRLYFNITYCIE